MESRLRIIRWLRLLLLSARMAARSRMLMRIRWFRRPNDSAHYLKKTRLKNRQRIKRLLQTMKIRLQILRWLSLLQFPACLGGQAGKLSQYALFRRIQTIQLNMIFNSKILKYKLLND